MLSFIKNLFSSRVFSIALWTILAAMMVMDNYSTESAANILERHGVPFDQIEQNSIVVALVDSYGWTVFHWIKGAVALILLIIILRLQGWMRIIANILLLPQTAIYCYIAYSNIQQLQFLWEYY